MAGKQGPGIDEIHVAITDVRPPGRLANAALMLIGAPPVRRGGMAMEAKILHPDGLLIAQACGAAAGHLFSLTGSFSRTRHASQAMGDLTQDFAALVGNQHCERPPPTGQRATTGH